MEKIYKDNTTLIVKESDIFRVQHDILKNNVKGIKVTTLNRFIQSFKPTQLINWTQQYQAYERFKNIMNELHYFKSSALSSTFINECLSFLNDMHLYNITIDDLPTNTKSSIELKKILSSIYDLPTQSYIQKELLSMIHDLKDVTIDIQYPSFKEHAIIQQFIEKGATIITHPISKPNYSFYYANNARCEVESIAQDIIKRKVNIDEVMIAYCDSKYSDLIASVFNRYQIPVHLNQTKSSSLAFKCHALLKFSLNPCTSTFVECLTQGCFNEVDSILEAQEIYPYNYNEEYPNLENIELQSELFNKQEINQLKTCIQKANIQKSLILQDLHQLANLSNIQELFLLIDEILRKNMTSSKEEINSLYKIQSIFRDSLPYLKSKEDFSILMDEIKRIKITNPSKRYNAVHVIPYSQINVAYPITYICGTTQNSFTEFKPLTGIFDENYVAQISKYPSLMDRYAHAQSLLTDKYQNGNEIIFSYPQSDYLGKNNEMALEIESISKDKFLSFPLIKQQETKEFIFNLEEEEAYSLYTNNRVIKGSISSLEKYVGCPYAYFLRYGCRIQEPIESGFNVQKIGTLNHSVLEELVLEHSKLYTKVPVDEITRIIDKNIHDMKLIFPHLQFDLIRKRLIDSMRLNLYILNEMENASSMTPTHCEYKWNKDIQMDDVTLSLVGYVDRIDTAPTTFRIIDYKSSQKNLDKEKVFSGQQLQLCTYLMQIKEELGLRPLGGFYYSFLNPKIELPYQKYSRSKKVLEEISNEMLEKEVIKNKRLQGWIFDDNVEIMDDTATHVKGLSNTKNKGIHARNVYDLEEVSESIVEIMKLIVEDILSGNIQCEPNEAACMFCKYKPICRFNGSFTEKKPLVDYPVCMGKE